MAGVAVDMCVPPPDKLVPFDFASYGIVPVHFFMTACYVLLGAETV